MLRVAVRGTSSQKRPDGHNPRACQNLEACFFARFHQILRSPTTLVIPKALQLQISLSSTADLQRRVDARRLSELLHQTKLRETTLCFLVRTILIFYN